jgi:hypothetical protein
MSTLHFHALHPYSMSMLHVMKTCMSMLHIPAASPCCMSFLHVHAACPCYMSMLRDIVLVIFIVLFPDALGID